MLFLISDIQKQPPEVFCKKKVFLEVLQNSQENTRARVFFNKVEGLRPATLLKKRLWHWCFPVNFAKFLRITFLQNTSSRLLLDIQSYENDTKSYKLLQQKLRF